MDSYRTKNVLVMWGDDFAHSNSYSYDILDRIMKSVEDQIEENGKANNFNLHYSSVEKYFDSVFDEANRKEVEWSVETDDFWDYDSNGGTWTGYFSTNPEFKKRVMDFSDFVQSAT